MTTTCAPQPSPLIQSAVNFSEGQRPAVIDAIAGAIASTPGAVLADCSADPDHARMVATILGPPEAIHNAVLAAARAAAARIDLRNHVGAHPRLGAIDVVPLAPARAITMEECVALSRRIARVLAAELSLPVYLYERSAGAGRRASLPEIRRGGFEGLFAAPLEGSHAPDFGPPAPHPTAGAAVVGARPRLVAYNVNLDSAALPIARQIAAAIRRDREVKPELHGVRALGFLLTSQDTAQVSMNLTRPALTPLPAVFDYVRAAAAELGARVRESEVIGLIPFASLGGEAPERILWRCCRQTQILEYWLDRIP